MKTHSDASDHQSSPSNSSLEFKATAFFAHVARLALRWALAVTILSAVADRFGLWGPPGSTNVSWGDWPHFVAYCEGQ